MSDPTHSGSGSANLPAAPIASGVLGQGAQELGQLESDYLIIAIFVRIQHLRFAEALALIDAVIAAGFVTSDLLFAKAVVENALQDHEAALATVRQLEKLDPAVITDGSKATKRARMRAYIKARACFSLNGALDTEAKAALDFYLRHGRKTQKS